MRNRKEHIMFCKDQAWKQYNYDLEGKEFSDPKNAFVNAATTMLCDLKKHPETEKTAELCTMLIFTVNDYNSMKKFIDGFN